MSCGPNVGTVTNDVPNPKFGLLAIGPQQINGPVTLAEVSDATRLSLSTLSRIDTGRGRLAKAYDTSQNELASTGPGATDHPADRMRRAAR